jgi:hypothetical protein
MYCRLIAEFFDNELAVGLSTGEQKFRIIPIMTGSINPCIKTASHNKTSRKVQSLVKGQGIQKPLKSKYTMKQRNKAFLLL